MTWLNDSIPERGSRYVSVNRKELNQTKRVFEYIAKEYPELASKAGISKELMFQKPTTIGKPGVGEQKQYKGEYFLNGEMISPLLRTSSDRMVTIQKNYMENVKKTLTMGGLTSGDSEKLISLPDPKTVEEDVGDIVGREEEEMYLNPSSLPSVAKISQDRVNKFSHVNKLIGKAILSC